MRILFITSSRLGEAVISCGILEHLRSSYPRAVITVACGARCAGLFSRLPRLERVIVVGKGSSRDFHRFRLWARLAGRFWDIAVDARGSGISRFLLTGQHKILRPGRTGLGYLQLAEAMGISPPPLPVTWTAAADQDEAERRLPAGTPIIGLGPTASWPRKIWPAERFIATAHAIEKILPGCRVVIFSGDSDAERSAAVSIRNSLPGAILMPADVKLPLLAACLARLRLFIGNDTGLLYLAAAAGVPTLGLFGPTCADDFAPAGPHAAAVAAPGPPGGASIEGLTADAVLAAIVPLLRA